MNNPSFSNEIQSEPKFTRLLSNLADYTSEIKDALYSIKGGLHRIQDTTQPSPIEEENKSISPNDLISYLQHHADALMLIRQELIGIDEKLNDLI